jgi:hypothetical protein
LLLPVTPKKLALAPSVPAAPPLVAESVSSPPVVEYYADPLAMSLETTTSALALFNEQALRVNTIAKMLMLRFMLILRK